MCRIRSRKKLLLGFDTAGGLGGEELADFMLVEFLHREGACGAFGFQLVEEVGQGISDFGNDDRGGGGGSGGGGRGRG